VEPDFEVPELSLRTGSRADTSVMLRPAAAERMGLSAERTYRVLEHPPAGILAEDEIWVDADGLPRAIPAGQIERRQAARTRRA